MSAAAPNGSNHAGQKRDLPLNQIYKLPVPIRTFPLPVFYPNNPISLFHLAYAWLGQLLSPPSSEPSVVYEATWSAGTGSVHVTDEKTVRALWEQGFYGKGSLSRSEPNWLRREQVRRGLEKSHVSELLTVQRREERLRAKWERARLEQEAIRLTREAEIRRAEKRLRDQDQQGPLPSLRSETLALPPTGPLQLLSLPNSAAELLQRSSSSEGDPPTLTPDDTISDIEPPDNENDEATLLGAPVTIIPGLHKLTSQKSVRFSPTVESTTFIASDPPSPNHTAVNGKLRPSDAPKDLSEINGSTEVTIVNKEHLQLMPEEALWLNFGLGVLTVQDPQLGRTLTSQELVRLCRQHSYFPPRNGPDDPDLEPDDSFLIHYAVYHHFRSLGWVPRAGIKFGVDWLLYNRGPVFDHAEFGLVVVPTYPDRWWRESGKKAPEKTWQWLHAVIRVLSHVMKSLVLVYVEVPPPPQFDKALDEGFAEALKLYKIREIMVKRWSSNRNR